ncbi:MAG: hypothetical protein LBH60_06850, partial [Prevotellaceae bacterium]|nr:hypothetical protein [Prevotellaceae bacterium]
MNNINRYAKIGVFVFATIAVTVFAIIHASLTGNNILLYSGSAFCLSLSFILLLFVLLCKSSSGDIAQELDNMKQREQIRLQEEQKMSSRDTGEQTEKLDINEAVSKILPPESMVFDNATLYTEKILQNIARELDIVQGLIFIFNDGDQQFHVAGEYAYYSAEQPRSFPVGETISGQVAKNRKLLNL